MAMVSWIFYKQKVLVVQVVAIVLGIAGVLMIFQREIFTKPDNIHAVDSQCSNVSGKVSGNHTEECVRPSHIVDTTAIVLGVILATGNAISGSGT